MVLFDAIDRLAKVTLFTVICCLSSPQLAGPISVTFHDPVVFATRTIQ